MSIEEKKQAGAMRIFEALSGVDEELLVRCEESGRKTVVTRRRPVWYYGGAVAACLCLMVCSGVLLQTDILSRDKLESAEYAVDTESIAQEIAACDAASPEENSLADSPETPAEDAGGVEKFNASEVNEEGIVTEGTEKVEGTAAAGTEKMEGTATVGTEKVQDGITAKTENGTMVSDEKNVVMTESAKSVKDFREKITFAEAKETAVLGAYVPDTVPEGFALEAVYLESNEDTGIAESISICWTKGMDSIFWSIKRVDTESVTTVDITRPETYDEHLYEIPYADTVPAEYRDSFHNPVFDRKDFSLGIVNARMKAVADVGDTDTPRGIFSVLYEDGVLVKFNGRSDAESVYKMFP